jgi:pimeloyl-ACP methyl ester carboxylesterase
MVQYRDSRVLRKDSSRGLHTRILERWMHAAGKSFHTEAHMTAPNTESGDTASREARATLDRIKVVPEATTDDAPLKAPTASTPTDNTSVRPFRATVSDEAITDLRRRIQATRWPDKETVVDPSQGPQLSNLQELVRYWGTDYDWRKGEAKLNALPQFVTNIDGVDIHFIHVRSRHKNALPVMISHGWPGSVFEQIKLIGPLTDPTTHGGQAGDAFDVVIPSLPGYGFSARPTEAGWGLERIGKVFDILMKRLGYTRYVAQGGDWGAGIVQTMGRQAPAGLLAIHTNLPAALPSDVGPALGGGPLPADISEQERATVNALMAFGQSGGLAYVGMMNARPQAVGYGMTDSPAGLAGFMLVHPGFEHWTYGKDPKQSPTRDDVLDDFTLYWLTNSAASAARIYWENRGRNLISSDAQKTAEISVPVAITVFPDEVYRPPETWARRAYRNLIYYHAAAKGGHFAAWEYPEQFTVELRAAFKTVR